MNNLVSVCIPAYNQPLLLKEAILSCLAQTYRPLEILVGDDSDNDASAEVINRLNPDDQIMVRYERNPARLGQADNVNRLFQRAAGDRIVLLHHDDLLLPEAIEDLAKCWIAHPDLTAAFGKQYFISETGELRLFESEHANEVFRRTAAEAGLQRPAVTSALMQQFPNDAFMVRAETAKRVRLRSRSEVGDATDLDFGIRLALENARFYFLDKYTSKYRETAGSLMRAGRVVEYMFPVVEQVEIQAEDEPARQAALRRMAPFYVKHLAQSRQKGAALRLLFSEMFDARIRWSAKGLVLLGQILFPWLDQPLRKLRHRFVARSRLTTLLTISLWVSHDRGLTH
jgi:glycosyltransferase involved in cell wall biosynthesis